MGDKNGESALKAACLRKELQRYGEESTECSWPSRNQPLSKDIEKLSIDTAW